MNEKKIKGLDEEIVRSSKKIKVLSALAWPQGEEEKFLENWNRGNPKLPKINLTPPDVQESISSLESIADQCQASDPVEKYLMETARSYAYAGRMISAVGTPDFTRYSVKIYGRPDHIYRTQRLTAIDAAKFFLEITDNLLGNTNIIPTETDISATEFAGWLKTEVDEFFEHDTVEVVVDPNMASKALAGATRIRVRGSAVFSQLDKDQLLYHEAFVHTATQLNGKKQLNLQSLGLGAPRTTRTQEGIAVLAELITNSIDISRLRRVALRVIAVQMALEGADFIELFKFFVDAGQTQIEAVRSAQRIFRGGAVKGSVVFTKDAVYLSGLLEVHTFLRVAIRDNRPDLVRNLFAGRMTIADAVRLAPQFDNGWLIPPVYIPTWASDLRRLAALLAYSAFVGNIKLDEIYLERALEIEGDLD